jgi:hypothetical protein
VRWSAVLVRCTGVRRVLDPRWDEALLSAHLGAFLLGFGDDATVAAMAAAS